MTKCLGECADVDASERLGKHRLARPATAPRLSDDSAVRYGNVPCELCRLQAAPHRAVVSFKGDQRTPVKDQLHAAPRRRLRPADRDLPRITTPDSAAEGRCVASPSAEISPNLASYAAMASAIAFSRHSLAACSVRARLTQPLSDWARPEETASFPARTRARSTVTVRYNPGFARPRSLGPTFSTA